MEYLDCSLRPGVYEPHAFNGPGITLGRELAVLHTPPKAHGINRTTWIMADLRRVLAEKGQRAGPQVIRKIIRDAGYTWRKARKVLTSTDPEYKEKLARIQSILSTLGPDERFFSIDEYGPFAVKMQGGRALTPPGEVRTVPQRQKSRGSLIGTAALELSTNQVTHFYSEKKNTAEMIRLLEVLLKEYAGVAKIYFSWDAASWYASKALYRRVEQVNSPEFRAEHCTPLVELAPLLSCAQFLDVIESVLQRDVAGRHPEQRSRVGRRLQGGDRPALRRPERVLPGESPEGRPQDLGPGEHAERVLAVE